MSPASRTASTPSCTATPTTSPKTSSNSWSRDRPRIVRPTCQSPVCSNLTSSSLPRAARESHPCHSGAAGRPETSGRPRPRLGCWPHATSPARPAPGRAVVGQRPGHGAASRRRRQDLPGGHGAGPLAGPFGRAGLRRLLHLAPPARGLHGVLARGFRVLPGRAHGQARGDPDELRGPGGRRSNVPPRARPLGRPRGAGPNGRLGRPARTRDHRRLQRGELRGGRHDGPARRPFGA